MWFDASLLGVFENSFFKAAIIVLICLIIAKITILFFKKVVEKQMKKYRHNKIDEKIVITIETPIILIILLVGFQLAIRKIITSTFFLENLINTIIVFIITYMFIEVTNLLLAFWARSKKMEHLAFHEEVLPLIKSLFRIILFIVAVIIILQIWNVEVGGLIASIGVISVVLGFAFQDTMKNIFGGMSLIVDDSLHKGDIIKTAADEIGEVVEINLRSTKLKTFDNDYLIIPNGLLSNSKFINYAAPSNSIRLTVPVAVAYGTNPEFVEDVVLNVIKGKKSILRLPGREFRFVKMGDYALEFQLLFYIADYKDRFKITTDVTKDIYKALQENNIEIPFPTRTVIIAPTTASTKQKTKIKKLKKSSSKKKK